MRGCSKVSGLLSLEGQNGRLRMGIRNGAETMGHDQLLGCASGVDYVNYYTTERTGGLCVGDIGQDIQLRL